MNIAVLLAGGTGARLGGDIPKQYIEVEGKPVIGYCLDTFFSHPSVDAVQVVADPSYHDYILSYINGMRETKEKAHAAWRGFSQPGFNRQMSICHALEDCLRYAEPSDCVMIHDAARPLVSREAIKRCFDSVKGHDGVLPVLPMKDTVYLSEDGKQVSSLLNREKIFAGQAPEVFRLGKYYEANRCLLPDKIRTVNGSTEPAVLAGMDIIMIDGDEGNFKITTAQDLERFRQKLSASVKKR